MTDVIAKQWWFKYEDIHQILSLVVCLLKCGSNIPCLWIKNETKRWGRRGGCKEFRKHYVTTLLLHVFVCSFFRSLACLLYMFYAYHLFYISKLYSQQSLTRDRFYVLSSFVWRRENVCPRLALNVGGLKFMAFNNNLLWRLMRLVRVKRRRESERRSNWAIKGSEIFMLMQFRGWNTRCFWEFIDSSVIVRVEFILIFFFTSIAWKLEFSAESNGWNRRNCGKRKLIFYENCFRVEFDEKCGNCRVPGEAFCLLLLLLPCLPIWLVPFAERVQEFN